MYLIALDLCPRMHRYAEADALYLKSLEDDPEHLADAKKRSWIVPAFCCKVARPPMNSHNLT